MRFDEAWNKADQVFGWLRIEEAEALFNAASSIPEDGLIVEVGAFCGRSTTVLAETGRRMLVVDPLEMGWSVGKRLIDDEVESSLRGVVGRYPRVKWSRTYSTKTEVPANIDMLYIDGMHKAPWPADDYKHFELSLVRGGVVAFHDYGAEGGVTEAVNDLIIRHRVSTTATAGTMWIGVKL